MGGRKKSLSHHLSRREPDDNELEAAVKEFTGGSDRVAAIMASALVEHHLMSAIRTALVDSFDDNALFHDQGAPFGTFKARIVAGRALGLYDKHMAEDLDTIRDIRNQFAHALLSIDFENQHLADRCMSLREHYIDRDGVPVKLTTPRVREISAPRERYEHVCWSLAILLIRKESEMLKKASEQIHTEVRRLQNVGQRNTLADFVAASAEGRIKDVEDNIAPDEG